MNIMAGMVQSSGLQGVRRRAAAGSSQGLQLGTRQAVRQACRQTRTRQHRTQDTRAAVCVEVQLLCWHLLEAFLIPQVLCGGAGRTCTFLFQRVCVCQAPAQAQNCFGELQKGQERLAVLTAQLEAMAPGASGVLEVADVVAGLHEVSVFTSIC